MKYLILIALLVISSSVSAQEEDATTPVIAVKIPLGETVNVDGVKICFKEVVEDSRCPTNVDCIWAGRVKILVEINGNRVEWIFGEIHQGESLDKKYTPNEHISIEGLQVTPYPDNPGQEMDYLLLVRTKKV